MHEMLALNVRTMRDSASIGKFVPKPLTVIVAGYCRGPNFVSITTRGLDPVDARTGLVDQWQNTLLMIDSIEQWRN